LTATRVCISGSRDFKNLSLVREFISSLPRNTTIVHGGARGVDATADAAARAAGLAVEVVPADWTRLGRAAGPIRNRAMVESCHRLVAFWDGSSRGTKSAIDAARAAKKELLVISDDS